MRPPLVKGKDLPAGIFSDPLRFQSPRGPSASWLRFRIGNRAVPCTKHLSKLTTHRKTSLRSVGSAA